MDKIYEQIVAVKLVKLIDEEHTLEEEVNELRESLCILLKFFEYNEKDSKPKVSAGKVFSINYEQAMEFTTDEFETTLKRLKVRGIYKRKFLFRLQLGTKNFN
jgi:hypothetical protein